MSLESLPVMNFIHCDPSVGSSSRIFQILKIDFLKYNMNIFAQLFGKWNMQNGDLSIANRIVRRFKNQQRHFIHFAELCHLTRLLRKASTGRSNFCLKYVARGMEATEKNQCLNRNCIDFFLLALSFWVKEIRVIRALSVNCWRHCERQMLTGHFVKLTALIMVVLARILYPMEFAPYVSFDELYANFDSFSKIAQTKELNVRILGLISAYEVENDTVELLSPVRLDSLPCMLVDVSLLPGDFKRSLTVDAGLSRLIQFIGTLSLCPSNENIWRLRALTHTFMDGVDMRSYGEVVRITRPYAQDINF
ncbi:unnamed protein product [Hydatigera taeniaeformis]|uniref:DUF4477 domain-containing protein n=1 Tax=Hydatigena taeniaeformis TaxID=6205 RepID=A0A0R3X464_HYDTA|nr:unnamed protein product [Hydatigera taeniaeformis]